MPKWSTLKYCFEMSQNGEREREREMTFYLDIRKKIVKSTNWLDTIYRRSPGYLFVHVVPTYVCECVCVYVDTLASVLD